MKNAVLNSAFQRGRGCWITRAGRATHVTTPICAACYLAVSQATGNWAPKLMTRGILTTGAVFSACNGREPKAASDGQDNDSGPHFLAPFLSARPRAERVSRLLLPSVPFEFECWQARVYEHSNDTSSLFR